MQVTRLPLFGQFHVQQALGYDPPVAVVGAAGVLDRVFEIEQHTRRGSRVALVDQHRAALQQVAMAFQGQVEHRIEQWVPRTEECCRWHSGRGE